MPTTEQTEKIRQAIMRYRELLDIMRLRLDTAERAYEALFADISPEDRSSIPVKTLQWRIAEKLAGNHDSFGKAILQIRFDARDLEREFETLYDRLVEDVPDGL
jgi:hypothetical protein